jgi:hypothetical protein
MMNNLYSKIVSSSQILGLIPLRIFIKNSKLAKEYEKFISQMLEWFFLQSWSTFNPDLPSIVIYLQSWSTFNPDISMFF